MENDEAPTQPVGFDSPKLAYPLKIVCKNCGNTWGDHFGIECPLDHRLTSNSHSIFAPLDSYVD